MPAHWPLFHHVPTSCSDKVAQKGGLGSLGTTLLEDPIVSMM